MTPKPAADIPVPVYRQILFWPLLLKELPTPSESDQLPNWLARFKAGGWTDPLPTLPSAITPERGDGVTYEEMVYFHPFVRDFLYGDGDPTSVRPLLRLERQPNQRVNGLTVRPAADGPDIRFQVPRLELYLCKPLVALVVLEIAEPVRDDGKPFTLADALTVQSQVRQVYPPFFIGGAAGNCPDSVTLHFADTGVTSDFQAGRDHFAKETHCGAEPPVAAHWRALLEPLKPFPGHLKDSSGTYTSKGSGPFYQQIEDDRMPGMTFLGVPNPRDISEGDYDRLTWCDTPGAGPYPYSARFLRKQRDEFTYDRFWDESPDNALTGNDTRYLCSGYQYVTVVRVGCGNDCWFAENILQDHFRRHYFRMALILHYQRSVLLKFQDEMAEAVKLIAGKDTKDEWANGDFRDRISHIQMTFLKFRTRAGFTEVSNQLQGRELFAWWAKLLGTDRLFQQVDGECQRLHAGLAEYETRELARSQERLAVAAFIGLPFSIVLAVLAALLTALQLEGANYDWTRTGRFVLVLLVTILAGIGIVREILQPKAVERLKQWFMDIK